MMKQHALFARVHAESAASREHLRLAGHFEFGLDRRPINPGDPATVAAVQACWAAGEEARGWARYWAMLYGHVGAPLAADAPLAARSLLLRYEDLCDRAEPTLAAIGKHIGAAPGSAAGLQQPDYYAPSFTGAEREAIAKETAAVASQFGY